MPTVTVTPGTEHKLKDSLLSAPPAMPGEQLQAEMIAAATTAMPAEMCGFVVNEKGKEKFVQCENLNKDVLDDWGKPSRFKIGADDFEKHDEQIIWVVHSHVFVKAEAFDADKSQAESAELPFLIVSVPTNQFATYVPNGWKAPLLNRKFVYGIHDCYHLVKDHFAEKHKIELPEFDYPDGWWKKKKDSEGKDIPLRNLMLENYEAAGFVRMDNGEELQVDDVILHTLDSDDPNIPNHASIYMGDSEIMHHVVGRLSCSQPYIADRGYYAQNAYCIIRHKTLMKEPPQ